MAKITLTEQPTSPTPPSLGQVSIYPKPDGEWYCMHDDGIEHPVGGAPGNVGFRTTPDITDNGDGTITVPSVIGDFFATSAKDKISVRLIAGGTLVPTDQVISYVVANLNNNNFELITNYALIDFVNYVPYAVADRNGLHTHVQPCPPMSYEHSEKAWLRTYETERYGRASGLDAISVNASLEVTISGGEVWAVRTKYALPASSATTRLFDCHHVAGVWTTTSSLNPKIDNLYYDDGTDLVAANNNKFIINYLFRGVEHEDHMYLVRGSTEYDSAESAQASNVIGDLPPLIQSHAIFVGRVIVEQAATSAYVIESAFTAVFGGATPITAHESLSGLQGGTTAEHYHLTSAEHTAAQTALTQLTGGATGEVLKKTSNADYDFEWGTGGGGGGTWGTITGTLSDQTDLQTALDSKQPMFNGLDDPTKFTITYSAVNRQFTITCTAGAAAWVGGVKYPISTTVTSTHANTTGKWYCYVDSAGAIQVTSSAWDLDTTAPLSHVYYNATTVDYWPLDERHPGPGGMSTASHKNNHLTRGTQFVSGFALSGYTLDTAGAAALSYAVASGIIADEDLYTSCTALADSGPYYILSRTGAAGDWIWTSSSTTAIEDNATNIYYNQFTGGAWQKTAVTTNNTWLNYYVVAVQSLTGKPQIAVLMGQHTYSDVPTAQLEDYSSFGLSSLSDEFVFLYRLTYRRINSSPSNAQLTAVQTLRTGNLGVGGSGGSSASSKMRVHLSPRGANLTGASTEPKLTAVAGTNKTYSMLAFADSGTQTVNWQTNNVETSAYAGGAITVRLRYVCTATTGNALFSVQLSGRTTGDTWDAALETARAMALSAAPSAGTVQTIDLTFTPTAVEISAGDMVSIKLFRSPLDVSDTLVGDVNVLEFGILEL